MNTYYRNLKNLWKISYKTCEVNSTGRSWIKLTMDKRGLSSAVDDYGPIMVMNIDVTIFTHNYLVVTYLSDIKY